jgi:hypothetical protein
MHQDAQRARNTERPTSPVRIALAWAAVMLPLAWGFAMTLIEASKLFY